MTKSTKSETVYLSSCSSIPLKLKTTACLNYLKSKRCVAGSSLSSVPESSKRDVLAAHESQLPFGPTIVRLKRVLVHLENENTIVFEPRMTGLVLLSDPPTMEHLRFQLQLSNAKTPTLQYWDRRGLGSVHVFTPDELEEHLGPGRLGPDALAVTPEILAGIFKGSRRPIKVALLDQVALAGVGNLYASEILFRARVHPKKRCSAMSQQQWLLVYTAMQDILTDAIKHEGSTLSDGTYSNALNDPGGYQNQHQVYDREGLPCPGCNKASIVRIVQTQRSTFFCKKCQGY